MFTASEMGYCMIETFIEVALKEDGDFLKVKETLTRIGIPYHKEKILRQSCHILHKRGKFYIVHFKELYALDELNRQERGLSDDGRTTDFSDDDRGRRNTIANLRSEWSLVTIVNPEVCESPRCPLASDGKVLIKVLPFREKADWILQPKYAIGKKKYDRTD